MRKTISRVLAAIAVLTAGAAPALACGAPIYQGACSPCGQAYVSPCAPPVYSTYERLPDPVQQYYYVDQGPTYSGPGDFAPYPTYREGAVSGWHAYRHHPTYYGYDRRRYAGAISHHQYFRPYRRHAGRYYGPHERVLRRYY